MTARLVVLWRVPWVCSEQQRPGPVCSQRTCLVSREDCLTGEPAMWYSDQSAARDITLSLRSRRDNKSGMRSKKREGRREMRVALEIRTSLRPEIPGTTPEGEARSKKEGREEEREPDNPDQSAARGVRSREERKSKQRKNRRDSEAGNRKGTRRQNTEEARREKSGRRKNKERHRSRSQGLGGNKGKRKAERYWQSGPVCGQKARYLVKGETRKNHTKKDGARNQENVNTLTESDTYEKRHRQEDLIRSPFGSSPSRFKQLVATLTSSGGECQLQV